LCSIMCLSPLMNLGADDVPAAHLQLLLNFRFGWCGFRSAIALPVQAWSDNPPTNPAPPGQESPASPHFPGKAFAGGFPVAEPRPALLDQSLAIIQN
jgi:hypothetical protein